MENSKHIKEMIEFLDKVNDFKIEYTDDMHNSMSSIENTKCVGGEIARLSTTHDNGETMELVAGYRVLAHMRTRSFSNERKFIKNETNGKSVEFYSHLYKPTKTSLALQKKIQQDGPLSALFDGLSPD